jgi:N utilization substance protein B
MWYFFDEWSPEDVDVDYVLQVWWSLKKYENGFSDKINPYTKTFSYEKMDPMDQVLLLLWYIEYKVLWTPKEVIINEMVELAKRYADDWSPKLVNGILHELLSKEESEK